MTKIEITDFKYSPKLKSLIIDYVARRYEENAIFDDYHLMMEYELLKKHGELNLLFEEEWFTGYMNDAQNYNN